MPSLPGFPIYGQITTGNKRYPVDLQPGTVATITLTEKTGDINILLLKDNQVVAQSEKDKLQDDQIIYAVEGSGLYQVKVAPFGSQRGTFTLDVTTQAAPVQPALFHAAMITDGSPDMQAYAAKLSNIVGAGAPAVIATQLVRQWQDGFEDTVTAGDLIIIGHDTHWEARYIRIVKLLATKPLLLIGAGGGDFLYVLKPELIGVIGETVGKDVAATLADSIPYIAAPYPITKYSFPDIYGKDAQGESIYQPQFGISYMNMPWHRILVDPWGMATVVEITPKIVFYGYPKVPDTWEIWGTGIVNAATLLAARGQQL